MPKFRRPDGDSCPQAQRSHSPGAACALRNVGTRLCLDVPEGSRNNVGQIWVYSCNGTSAQLWTRTPSGQITVYDGQKCLDALEQGKTDGTAVGIRDCQGGDNQRWQAV
ncbi:RICIN domain-containing protein [Nonomuraea jabiensis]|uniref:Ricin B lectin domain-containing protein n=1 Tax=Nonomuraea jabiensis TaxID=882448 RepID=A0A7W9LFD2_9ACTN|nr:RICIN domain-containing protein [Nonomuraea jabiensis]MBB5781648.1 hypothetical protein [Nonomuraea jabiensis]